MADEKVMVALLSAGLDSSAALFLAKKEGWDIRLALTFDYGQRAAAQELVRANQLAKFFQVPLREISLPWFAELEGTGQLLQSSATLPEPTIHQLEDRKWTKQSARSVWVPNRNGVFIEIAAAFAESLGAQAIVVGFNSEEAITFPDNSEEYIEHVSRALFFSTSNHVEVISPTSHLTKADIVRAVKNENFPLHLVWSCYESREKMCGRCESCMRLKRALVQNEVKCDEYFEHSILS